MEMYRQHFPEELVSKRWFRPQDSESMARFTIRLPSHDRKLKQYGHWHRANYHHIDGLPNPDDVFARWAIDTWWLYFGDTAVEDQGMHNRGSDPLSARLTRGRSRCGYCGGFRNSFRPSCQAANCALMSSWAAASVL
jgi:hypothetical protein